MGRIASVIGLLLLGVLSADVSAGPAERVAADSTLAMFLLGLAIGVPTGIGLFFGYLILRERRQAEQPDDLDLLFDSLETEEEGPWTAPADTGFRFDRDGAFRDAEEEPIETHEPWERPADWWRDSDD
jgi:hypothetical protein